METSEFKKDRQDTTLLQYFENLRSEVANSLLTVNEAEQEDLLGVYKSWFTKRFIGAIDPDKAPRAIRLKRIEHAFFVDPYNEQLEELINSTRNALSMSKIGIRKAYQFMNKHFEELDNVITQHSENLPSLVHQAKDTFVRSEAIDENTLTEEIVYELKALQYQIQTLADDTIPSYLAAIAQFTEGVLFNVSVEVTNITLPHAIFDKLESVFAFIRNNVAHNHIAKEKVLLLVEMHARDIQNLPK